MDQSPLPMRQRVRRWFPNSHYQSKGRFPASPKIYASPILAMFAQLTLLKEARLYSPISSEHLILQHRIFPNLLLGASPLGSSRKCERRTEDRNPRARKRNE